MLLTIEDRTIEVKLYGNGSRKVVFLHGFGSSAAAVPDDEDILRQHDVQLICPNRPGVGRSSVQKAFTVESVAHDLHMVLQHLQIDDCVIVGWSAGGVYAQCFAARYPQQTRALHLIGSSVPFAQDDADTALNARWTVVRLLDRWVPFITKPLFRKTSRKLHQAPDKVMSRLTKGLTESDKAVAMNEPGYTLLRNAACDGLAHDGMGAYEEARALGKANIDYSKLACPTHIWAGDDDSILPLKTSHYLCGHIPGSQLHIIHNAGYFLHIKEWRRLVAAFAQAS